MKTLKKVIFFAVAIPLAVAVFYAIAYFSVWVGSMPLGG